MCTQKYFNGSNKNYHSNTKWMMGWYDHWTIEIERAKMLDFTQCEFSGANIIHINNGHRRHHQHRHSRIKQTNWKNSTCQKLWTRSIVFLNGRESLSRSVFGCWYFSFSGSNHHIRDERMNAHRKLNAISERIMNIHEFSNLCTNDWMSVCAFVHTLVTWLFVNERKNTDCTRNTDSSMNNRENEISWSKKKEKHSMPRAI